MIDPSISPGVGGVPRGVHEEDWDSILANEGIQEGRKKAKKWVRFRTIDDGVEAETSPKVYSGMCDAYLRQEKLQTLNSNTSPKTGIQTFNYKCSHCAFKERWVFAPSLLGKRRIDIDHCGEHSCAKSSLTTSAVSQSSSPSAHTVLDTQMISEDQKLYILD